MNAILSIKPKYVEEIAAGRKKFEFRKNFFSRPVEKVYVYATAPISRIVGEFRPALMLAGSPWDIWRFTDYYTGMTKQEFDEYYKGRELAYAILIDFYKKYKHPVCLPKGMRAPQSYCYLDPNSKFIL